jgi:perosamine synthetase
MSYEPDPNHPLTTAFPYFPPDEQEWLTNELREIMNGQLAMGPRVARFEKEFAAYCDVPYAVAFPSCTSSMEAALKALVGARPVFTEISPSTFSMDFDDAWSKVSARTRGAIVVHFGGFISPDLPAFVQKMHDSGRFVIEDAAHAPGAELNGKRAGAFADAGCFSFYPTKIMTTGEGGMLAKTARSLQNRGRDMNNPLESYVLPGRNNRFTEIAAAMGLSQLRCLPEFLNARRRVAAIYDELLLASELFVPLIPGEKSAPAYWRYVATPSLKIDRQLLRERLAADGITIDWAYDPPLHLQPVFREMFDTKPGLLPKSEEILSRHICLPVHARMRDVDAQFVSERLLYYTRALSKTL